ncbi:hypothetical protein METH_00690 [Leisingera methylohalidivorans DSM 14336]|uniref:Uncharacterized protein n=1 Tax=Leisingera methylohalidivorans DSM 14336 TaxID=999552 RepID=V9VY09_9RHOB|nr:hypothetical protein METH_00690 [Leisingera methylohalidivorans DSM 14336]
MPDLDITWLPTIPGLTALAVSLLETAEEDLILAYEQWFAAKGPQVEPLIQLQPNALLPSAHPSASRQELRVKGLQGMPNILAEEPGQGHCGSASKPSGAGPSGCTDRTFF